MPQRRPGALRFLAFEFVRGVAADAQMAPNRTHLAARVVANGEHQVELRRARRRELVPALRAQLVDREPLPCQLLQGVRMHFAFGKLLRNHDGERKASATLPA